ncbi:MAG: UDP-N-acetylglucosamine--N-acetylmuramyl-(pentapeptide) pyrophosphoryl-undecaprenol N-acetylglucosamine transferase [Sandaracinaceae bacterium]|nr:UDP-N-acetylglucosamine--N-acetylmuramyl-(pentapeptide) pyrophosphoryl-undecaprenol N-acetylglucosamine transferase [Sandaracinaceae bacterium]
MIRRIIVAGGGTGGHLFPGIAVVEELRRRQPDVEVTFVGTAKGIEARDPGAGRAARAHRRRAAQGPHGRGADAQPLHAAGRLLAGPRPHRQAPARSRDRRGRLRIRAHAARGGRARRPHGHPRAERARRLLTNRVLAPIAGRAYVAWEEAAAQIGKRRAKLLGNPVRRAFVDAARAALSDPDGFEARSRKILVLGGSQGAKVLNETVPAALADLDLASRGVEVLHQTGAAMREAVEARYRELGVPAEVVSFVDDMAKAYATATLVIARAGATTLAELCAIGRPSILVPYPYAADDHQARNAEALERAGAAVAIREDALTAERLASEARALLDDAERRKRMAEAARKHGRPDAAAAIVDDLFAWLGGPTERRSVAPSARGDHDGGEGSRFASVDFTAGRAMSMYRRRSSAPPPVRLQVIGASAMID